MTTVFEHRIMVRVRQHYPGVSVQDICAVTRRWRIGQNTDDISKSIGLGEPVVVRVLHAWFAERNALEVA